MSPGCPCFPAVVLAIDVSTACFLVNLLIPLFASVRPQSFNWNLWILKLDSSLSWPGWPPELSSLSSIFSKLHLHLSVRPSLLPSLSGSLSPSPQPFNVKHIKELSWNDKCFISSLFWRVNTKKKRKEKFLSASPSWLHFHIRQRALFTAVTSHLHSSLFHPASSFSPPSPRRPGDRQPCTCVTKVPHGGKKCTK